MDKIKMLPASLEVKYDCLKIDDIYVSTVVVIKYSENIAIIDTVKQLMQNEDVEISFHITRENNANLLKKLTNIIAESSAEMGSVSKNQMDINLLDNEKKKALELRKKIQIDNEQIYMLSTYILIKANTVDELLRKQKKYMNVLYTNQIISKPANFRQKEAYLATIPFNQNNSLISKYTHSIFTERGLAKLFPFFDSSVLNRNGILIGKANTNFCSIDIFSKNNNNYNMCIFGASGAGKSYFVKLMILKNAYKGIRQIVIDPEGEYVNFIKSLGGHVYTIENYNPMVIDEHFAKNEDFFNRKLEQVLDYVYNINSNLSTADKEKIKSCIEKIYNKYGINNNVQSLYKIEDYDKVYIKPQYIKEFPSIEEVYNLMEEEEIINYKIEQASSKVEENNNSTELYCFHIKGKNTADIQREMKIFLPKIYELIKEETLIYFDEVWKGIGNGADRYVIDNVYNMFKTLRKKTAGIIIISQDVCDLFMLDEGNFGKSILNNSNIKVLFKMGWQDIDVFEKMLTNMMIGEKIKELSRGNAFMCMGNTSFNLEVKAADYEHKLIEGDKYEENINCYE